MISARMMELLDDVFGYTLAVESYNADEFYELDSINNGCNTFLRFGIDNPFIIPVLFEHIFQYFALGDYIVFPINISNELFATTVKRPLNIFIKAFGYRNTASCIFNAVIYKEKKYYVAPGIILDEYFNIIIAVCKKGIYGGTERIDIYNTVLTIPRPVFNNTVPVFMINNSIYSSSDPIEKYILKEILPYITTRHFRVSDNSHSPFRMAKVRMEPEIEILNTIKYTMKPTIPKSNTNDKELCRSVLNDIKEIYNVNGIEKVYKERELKYG